MCEANAPSGTGVSGNEELILAVRGVLERLAALNAQALAEIVSLYLDHPRWAVWLPAS